MSLGVPAVLSSLPNRGFVQQDHGHVQVRSEAYIQGRFFHSKPSHWTPYVRPEASSIAGA